MRCHQCGGMKLRRLPVTPVAGGLRFECMSCGGLNDYESDYVRSHARPKSDLAKFQEFDHDNPEIWDLFEHYTLQAIHAGFQHYSAWAVVNRIRWHVMVETRTADEFKISNNYIAYYARKFMSTYPPHRGLFQIKRMKNEPYPELFDD